MSEENEDQPPTLSYATPPRPRSQTWPFVGGVFVAVGFVAFIGVIGFGVMYGSSSAEGRVLVISVAAPLIALGIAGIAFGRAKRRPFLLGMSCGLVVMSLIEGLCYMA